MVQEQPVHPEIEPPDASSLADTLRATWNQTLRQRALGLDGTTSRQGKPSSPLLALPLMGPGLPDETATAPDAEPPAGDTEAPSEEQPQAGSTDAATSAPVADASPSAPPPSADEAPADGPERREAKGRSARKGRAKKARSATDSTSAAEMPPDVEPLPWPPVRHGGAVTVPSGTTRAATRSAARAESLTMVYGSGQFAVRALDRVTVDLRQGEMTAIMGPSGSGKSTLMHCMAGLDRPTSGRAFVGDTDITSLSERNLTAVRRTRIGFVFQAFNLVPTLSAAENITLPMDIARTPVDRDWFQSIVETMGLADRLDHRPSELSGGQQQRVACARALIAKPAVVFADEPTGNLDSSASAEVLTLLRRCVDDFDQCVVMVTHDAVAASYAHRAIFLADGRVAGECAEPSPDQIMDQMLRISRR